MRIAYGQPRAPLRNMFSRGAFSFSKIIEIFIKIDYPLIIRFAYSELVAAKEKLETRLNEFIRAGCHLCGFAAKLEFFSGGTSSSPRAATQ